MSISSREKGLLNRKRRRVMCKVTLASWLVLFAAYAWLLLWEEGCNFSYILVVLYYMNAITHEVKITFFWAPSHSLVTRFQPIEIPMVNSYAVCWLPFYNICREAQYRMWVFLFVLHETIAMHLIWEIANIIIACTTKDDCTELKMGNIQSWNYFPMIFGENLCQVLQNLLGGSHRTSVLRNWDHVQPSPARRCEARFKWVR